MTRRTGCLVTLVVVVALSGGSCSAGAGTSPTAIPTTVSTGSGSDAAGAPTDSDGTGGAIHAPDDGAVGTGLRLTVDAIEVVTSCPGRGVPVQMPSHGYFVVLDVTASLDAEAVDPGAHDTYAPLGAERFHVTAPDGTVQETSSTEASWACYENDELLPPFVGAGETVSGRLVLDSASEHGTVTYGRDQAAGRSWAF